MKPVPGHRPAQAWGWPSSNQSARPMPRTSRSPAQLEQEQESRSNSAQLPHRRRSAERSPFAILGCRKWVLAPSAGFFSEHVDIELERWASRSHLNRLPSKCETSGFRKNELFLTFASDLLHVTSPKYSCL